MTNWLKLVAAIILAEAVEHAAEHFFDSIKVVFARWKRRRRARKY